MASCCCRSVIVANQIGSVWQRRSEPRRRAGPANSRAFCFRARASAVDSYESSSNFAKRTEQAWLISQIWIVFVPLKKKTTSHISRHYYPKQPRPVGCSSCDSNGHVECKWCGGTGFFILGDNMLCQVPSRNTTCVICCGKGSMCCSDCKGTGFRAVWLGEPVPK